VTENLTNQMLHQVTVDHCYEFAEVQVQVQVQVKNLVVPPPTTIRTQVHYNCNIKEILADKNIPVIEMPINGHRRTCGSIDY